MTRQHWIVPDQIRFYYDMQLNRNCRGGGRHNSVLPIEPSDQKTCLCASKVVISQLIFYFDHVK